MKVLVEKENYNQVREAESLAGYKVKYLQMYTTDCVDGVWGVYQIIHCYKSFGDNYFAELKLIKKAQNEADSHVKFMEIVNRLKADK